MQGGELHRLRAPEGGLSAVQYVRDGEVVVLAWLQAQHYGEPVPPVRLGASTRRRRTNASKRAKSTGVRCFCTTGCGRGCGATSMRQLSACVACD